MRGMSHNNRALPLRADPHGSGRQEGLFITTDKELQITGDRGREIKDGVRWKMRPDQPIYEETIPLWLFTALLGGFAAVCLFLAVYQIVNGPGGADSPPPWFFLLIGLFFLGMALNFRTLRIELSQQAVMVGYGIAKRTIPWEVIERCYRDNVSNLRYGGWGIRIGRVQGKWRLVYNTPGAPRVVLALNRGWFPEFVFSTRHPDEVLKIIQERIGRGD